MDIFLTTTFLCYKNNVIYAALFQIKTQVWAGLRLSILCRMVLLFFLSCRTYSSNLETGLFATSLLFILVSFTVVFIHQVLHACCHIGFCPSRCMRKVQLISKWFFGVIDFLQKTNENKST